MSDINFGNPFTDISAESVEEVASQRFAPPSSTPRGDSPLNSPEDEVEGDELAHSSPSTKEETPTTSSPPTYQINGREYSQADIESFAQFDNLLRSDPRLAQTIYDYLHGVPSSGGVGTTPGQQGSGITSQGGWGSSPPSPTPLPTPTSQVPQISPEALEDPTINFLWNTIQQQNDTINNFRQEITRQGSLISSRVEAESRGIIDTAVSEFKQNYGVDDETVALVRNAAARLEVIPSVLRGIDPITGQPTDPNPLNAIRRAMEIAAYSVPEVRDRIIASQLATQQQDALRKSRLNAIGGSSRPVPRNTPAPTSPQEFRNAMIQEVAAAMNGNTGQE